MSSPANRASTALILLLVSGPRYASSNSVPPFDLLVDSDSSDPASLSSYSSVPSSLCRRETQPDGTLTVPLCLSGDETCPYWTHYVSNPFAAILDDVGDGDGIGRAANESSHEEEERRNLAYTVTRDDGGWFVYVAPPSWSMGGDGSSSTPAPKLPTAIHIGKIHIGEAATGSDSKGAANATAGEGGNSSEALKTNVTAMNINASEEAAGDFTAAAFEKGSNQTTDPPSWSASTLLRVSADSDPLSLGLSPDALPPCEYDRRDGSLEPFGGVRIAGQGGGDHAGEVSAASADASSAAPGIIGLYRLLVLPVRFANHASSSPPRSLPSVADIDDLFNRPGPSPAAPRGSVRDFFLSNSYGKFDVRSVVPSRWIDLDGTEEYYSEGDFGHKGRMKEALVQALDELDDDPDFVFEPALKEDGAWRGDWLGAVLLHSGSAAEWGGTDCYTNADYTSRIWSFLSSGPTGGWTSKSTPGGTLFEGPFAVSSVSWQTCSSDVVNKLGPIVHEIGHMLGLSDLYGGANSVGVGNHDFMGSAWGFGAHTESPTSLSAYHKIRLGWLIPTVLDEGAGGRYEITPSETTAVAYKVTAGYPEGEYLLVENRQPVEFDAYIGPGGLAIWHVDENQPYNGAAGNPWEDGWPGNGVGIRTRLTLLQADERYHMERKFNQGDGKDYFRNRGPGGVRPTRVGLRGGGAHDDGGPFPNSDSYRSGGVRRTGVRIYSITRSQTTMKFSFSYSDPRLDDSLSRESMSRDSSRDAIVEEDLHARRPHKKIKK